MSIQEQHKELYVSLFNFYHRNTFFTGVLYTDCNDAFEYNIYMEVETQNRAVVLYYTDESDEWVLAHLNPEKLTETNIKRWKDFDRLSMLIAFTNAVTMVELGDAEALARASATDPS